MDMSLWLQLLGFVFGSGALFVVWRWLRNTNLARSLAALSSAADTREVVDRVNQHLAVITASVETIQREVVPNGGGSMKDAIGRIERQLRNHRLALRAYADSHDRPMFEALHSGEWVWTSSALSRLIRRSPQELLRWNWVNLIDPDETVGLRLDLASAAHERRELHRRVGMIRTDTVLVTEWRMVPIPADDGSEAHDWLGYIREYSPTERHKAIEV